MCYKEFMQIIYVMYNYIIQSKKYTVPVSSYNVQYSVVYSIIHNIYIV